ncbi:isopenicillin N synthase family oxygenase [Methyloligella sp. 2.7D]|uniref:isopenicillin N synthase family dioxygenase n=1 Tax=unclassified Methyloligella TaxID=2625955 RepID=UPI00157C7C51|nr:isopenicillin N synthase family oxygenase [Methyloligella sp. GL2]QKP78300.1 isopenicillin N synthase family oxygenase [Methyloligella sp. GL2]
MSSFKEIPLVDITDLGSPDAAKHKAVIDKIREASENVGFLYISGHGIPEETVAGLRKATKDFFDLPLEEKMKVYIGNSSNHRGYVPEGEEVFASGSKDKKEAYDLSLDLPKDDPDFLAGNPMLGPNQWPSSPDFKEKITAYYNAAFDLGGRLIQGFAEALGLEPTALDHFFTKPPSQLRLIHYPFDPDAPPDQAGIGAHTDYEAFTLLLPTAPGLEVMNDEGEWIDAPPVEGAFVINIGDTLEVWSNGRFTATSHRVRKVKEERYSFPLFYSADYWAKVEPMPEFVSDGTPPAYEPLIAGEHLHAQTAQTFTYLKERMARGELVLPENSRALSSFGQEAKRKAS